MILAGKDADLVVFETQTDLYELKAAVLAAKENSDLPVVCTMTFEMNHRTFTGCGVANMALTLNGLDVDAMGVNCSLGPTDLYEVIEELTKYTDKPIVVKPNAGLPDPITNEYDIDAGEFAKQMAGFKNYGVKCVGGCCGTNPDYIRELVTTFDENDGLLTVPDNDIITKTNTNYILIIKKIYEEAKNRFIYYHGNWYPFTAENDVLCPIDGLIDYYCEIVKGVY